MIDYLSLAKITAMHRDEIMEAVARVVDSGWYLQGEACARFEQEYAAYIGSRFCVGCGNGLDALSLIFRAYREMGVLQEGDEVIVPANTYIASILSITENRLKPVLVEPRVSTLQIDDALIEEAVTSRTRALLLVHLYGRNAWTPAIQDLCERHKLKLIEDNAQAQGCYPGQHPLGYRPAPAGEMQTAIRLDAPAGAEHGEHGFEDRMGLGECSNRTNRQSPYPVVHGQNWRTGSLGSAAAHSFYPGKNLGAMGDAGAVTTSDEELARVVRALGNYGSTTKYVFPYRGRNSRLDELQAAVLSVKLRYLDADNRRRKEIAQYYYANISHPEIYLPGKAEWEAAGPMEDGASCRDESCVYHIFPLLTPHRDRLQQYLHEQGIGTMIHYPIPPHKQSCYSQWNALTFPVTEYVHQSELSIPCNQALTDAEVEEVCRCLNRFSV